MSLGAVYYTVSFFSLWNKIKLFQNICTKVRSSKTTLQLYAILRKNVVDASQRIAELLVHDCPVFLVYIFDRMVWVMTWREAPASLNGHEVTKELLFETQLESRYRYCRDERSLVHDVKMFQMLLWITL